MTLTRMPSRPRAVTRPRPQTAPGAGRRAARVRPYYRHQAHHQVRVTRPVGQAAPMRDRAVLDRVLAGLRRLPAQPAAQDTVPSAVQSAAPSRPVPPSLSLLPPLADSSAATGTADASPALVAVSGGGASAVPPVPPAREATVRSLLGRKLMPLVRAVLARRPEVVVPAARVEPSPDAVRTQPMSVVGVGP